LFNIKIGFELQLIKKKRTSTTYTTSAILPLEGQHKILVSRNPKRILCVCFLTTGVWNSWRSSQASTLGSYWTWIGDCLWDLTLYQ